MVDRSSCKHCKRNWGSQPAGQPTQVPNNGQSSQSSGPSAQDDSLGQMRCERVRQYLAQVRGPPAHEQLSCPEQPSGLEQEDDLPILPGPAEPTPGFGQLAQAFQPVHPDGFPRSSSSGRLSGPMHPDGLAESAQASAIQHASGLAQPQQSVGLFETNPSLGEFNQQFMALQEQDANQYAQDHSEGEQVSDPNESEQAPDTSNLRSGDRDRDRDGDYMDRLWVSSTQMESARQRRDFTKPFHISSEINSNHLPSNTRSSQAIHQTKSKHITKATTSTTSNVSPKAHSKPAKMCTTLHIKTICRKCKHVINIGCEDHECSIAQEYGSRNWCQKKSYSNNVDVNENQCPECIAKKKKEEEEKQAREGGGGWATV
ncbi:hypothetical protein FALBO_5342 [Fusarium albosuccineum]|uniref:Uncharacterized protein n=1 Tax=Fusarium albosuccineum TaxID=1237068 RepID=A0A8H4PEC7_9HYPO|nr:hypothetical protein FALBO_5342 [Fusarium albosuccineum]